MVFSFYHCMMHGSMKLKLSVPTGRNAAWDPHSAEVVEKGNIRTCNRRELKPMHQSVAKSLD